MADNVQLNLATTSGSIIAADECVINTATVAVQRMKIGIGTDGAYVGDVALDNPLPVRPGTGVVFTVSGNVTLAAGTATVGTFTVNTLPAGTATIGSVILGAGTATIGTVALPSGQTIQLAGGTATVGVVSVSNFPAFVLVSGSSHAGAFHLETSTGGLIPADTTSGLAVKFVNTPSVNATLGAGTATIGTVELQTSAAVALKAGTATVGTVTVNTLPAGTATIGSVVLGAGTATVGTVTVNTLPAGTATIGSVVLGVGTATVGSVILSPGTATVGTVLVGAGTATIGSVVLGIGTATVGTVHLSTTDFVTLNAQPLTATNSRGPKVVNVTATGTTALVSAVGANTSIYVTSIMANNTATVVSPKLSISDGETRLRSSLAANGGGYVFNFHPPWKLAGNTALNAIVTAGCDIEVNVHYYSGVT
jgi:fibronectin-binding autotransporter adhesin